MNAMVAIGLIFLTMSIPCLICGFAKAIEDVQIATIKYVSGDFHVRADKVTVAKQEPSCESK